MTFKQSIVIASSLIHNNFLKRNSLSAQQKISLYQKRKLTLAVVLFKVSDSLYNMQLELAITDSAIV